MITSARTVEQLWRYYRTLRDAGVGFDHYSEQLTYMILRFLQHATTLLPFGVTTAIVVPDAVLNDVGFGASVRGNLLSTCDVHTLLRLPVGAYHAAEVQANVLFVDHRPARRQPWTETLWVYDLRTGKHFPRQSNPLHIEDARDFLTLYCPGNRPARQETERFRPFSYATLQQRDHLTLDICWLTE